MDVVEQERQGEASGAQEPEINTAVLAERVRHYLKANQIQWTRFASLVLGVSQGRLSILLGKPKPWQQLAPRVRALYERMLLWMDTKATFGNNPYMKVKKEISLLQMILMTIYPMFILLRDKGSDLGQVSEHLPS